MIITLIGFSGSGKSVYSKELEQLHSWDRIDCDTLILHELNKAEGIQLQSLPEIATWHGAPNEEDFPRRDSLLLELEHKVMLEILEANITEKNIVLDTSGSFVLLPEETILKFKKISKLIYLKYEEEDMELMIEQYFKEPKPVIWQHLYTPNAGEDFLDSVKRCYVNLVHYRRKLYEKYADLTIDISFKKRGDLSIHNILKQHEIL